MNAVSPLIMALLVCELAIPAWAQERPHLFFVDAYDTPYSDQSGFITDRVILQGGAQHGQVYDLVTPTFFAPGRNPSPWSVRFMAASPEASRQLKLLEQSAGTENVLGLCCWALLLGAGTALGIAAIPGSSVNKNALYTGLGLAALTILPWGTWYYAAERSISHMAWAVDAWNTGQ